jgi:hypothetical protein
MTKRNHDAEFINGDINPEQETAQDQATNEEAKASGFVPPGSALVPGADLIKSGELATFMAAHDIKIFTTMDAIDSMIADLEEATKLEDMIGQEIEIANMMLKLHLFPADAKEGKEERMGLLMVLVDSKGGVVRAASNGALHCLTEVCKYLGKPPWNPAWRFKVTQKSVPIPGTNPVRMGRTFKLIPIRPTEASVSQDIPTTATTTEEVTTSE